MARKWVRRGLGACILALVGTATWAAMNRDQLMTRYAAHRFTAAANEAERAQWAEDLATRDPQSLVAYTTAGSGEVRASATAALAKHLESLPPADSHGSEIAGQLLDAFASAGESERDALAGLLPVLVFRGGTIHAGKSKAAVVAGLKMPLAKARVSAIRAAVAMSMRGEIVPMLSAPEPEVRRAAMFAVGPATEGESVIGDEELFHWLHDPDGDVRTICRAALVSRGRSDSEIVLGKKLIAPDAAERLTLLVDLRYEDELPDVEPWLERLSRDVEPGVRAGSVRVMMEIKRERGLPTPAWVSRIADADPCETVRHVARVLMQPSPVVDSSIRLIEGP